jgi:hypothetical protein
MSNNKTANINESSISVTAVAYYAFTLIIVGTAFNLLTFVVLCRKKFRNMKERPTLYYMRAVVIFDIFMLYGWNFEHYLSIVYGFAFREYTIASCKLFMFSNYLSHHTSAWLRVFICLDRYLSLSRLHRTWFGRPKSVLIIIACIISFFFLFNLHLIIFGCFRDADGTIDANSRLYIIYPMWDMVNLAMYNCIPFVSMVILNCGVIYHLFNLRRSSTIQNSRIQHRAISITVVITTFLFSLMTIPSTVAYAFFTNTASDTALYTLDCVLYSYHTLSFAIYMITFKEFRQEFIKMVTCNNNEQRIAPENTAMTQQSRRK